MVCPDYAFDELLKVVAMNDQLACAQHVGGCGKPNHIHHILSSSPHAFTVGKIFALGIRLQLFCSVEFQILSRNCCKCLLLQFPHIICLCYVFPLSCSIASLSYLTIIKPGTCEGVHFEHFCVLYLLRSFINMPIVVDTFFGKQYSHTQKEEESSI
jgi:hypothetical protein